LADAFSEVGPHSRGQLQQNTDLNAPNWINVTNPVIPTNAYNQVILPNSGGNRFYRLALP
jgi:hypothetical protein